VEVIRNTEMAAASEITLKSCRRDANKSSLEKRNRPRERNACVRRRRRTEQIEEREKWLVNEKMRNTLGVQITIKL
jgi:hypothetical protein